MPDNFQITSDNFQHRLIFKNVSTCKTPKTTNAYDSLQFPVAKELLRL